MKNSIAKLFIFATGAAVGSLITYYILKDKYAKIAQEEIDSVKEVFSKRADKKEKEPKKVTRENYEKIVGGLGYSDISRKEVKQDMSDMPYVIQPEEFGDMDEYEQISLTYYADGVLADDMDEPVEDVDNTVGEDSLRHFGEYEDDSVFVRNERLKADFEILKDLRRFSEVKNE